MNKRALTDALAGALMLAIGMGLGRFAFTGLHPQMLADALHGRYQHFAPALLCAAARLVLAARLSLPRPAPAT
jgi:hypothetical protein